MNVKDFPTLLKAEGSSQHSTSDWCKTGGDNAYPSYPVTCCTYAI